MAKELTAHLFSLSKKFLEEKNKSGAGDRMTDVHGETVDNDSVLE